jgi:hypothetical protein
MRRLARIVLAAGLAVLAAPAGASAMIQVDRGIAGARLNNTEAQVRAALGAPRSIQTGTNDFGGFRQFRYRGGIRVLFSGALSGRVSLVSTTGLGDRTSRGVGVGSRERAVRRKVPGVRCETLSGDRMCHTNEFQGGQRVTVFFIRPNGRVRRVDVGIVID